MQPPGWRLQTFESLPSTQDVCRALTEAGDPGRVAVRADRQTSGRGRDGRAWEAPPGNLSLSVMLRPGGTVAEAGQWSLLAGVALAETAGAFLPATARVRLKWPNDLMVADAKLAGILIESSADAAGGLDWLVIGFGVNLAAAPDVPGRAVTCFASFGSQAEPAQFTTRLLEALDHWDGVRARRGFAAIRQAWLMHAPAPGEAIAVRNGGKFVHGAFAGLSDNGAVLVDVGERVMAFASGEIVEAVPCCS